MAAIYEQRSYDEDPRYSDLDPAYLHRVQSTERRVLESLRCLGVGDRLPSLRVLDYGCGNGKWLGRWLAWGASPDLLSGTDIRPAAVERAHRRFPQIAISTLDEAGAPFPDASVDLVFVNLVLSSILTDRLRASVASDIARLVRPGGHVLICDFAVNNPANPDVKAVRWAEIRRMFEGFESVYRHRLVLAPPLARRVVPRSWLAATVLEAALPPLRTHRLVGFRKPEGADNR